MLSGMESLLPVNNWLTAVGNWLANRSCRFVLPMDMEAATVTIQAMRVMLSTTDIIDSRIWPEMTRNPVVSIQSVTIVNATALTQIMTWDMRLFMKLLMA